VTTAGRSSIGRNEAKSTGDGAVAEEIMEKLKQFPSTIFVSSAGSGDDTFLSGHETEEDAIEATDDETIAEVGEYQLVMVRYRRIVKSVVDESRTS
jgi:hypothetical protein